MSTAHRASIGGGVVEKINLVKAWGSLVGLSVLILTLVAVPVFYGVFHRVKPSERVES